jgi:hypothetical protein
MPHVRAVRNAWNRGTETMSMHGSDEANIWYRQPFCECQPHHGAITETMLGVDDQGHLDVFDVDSEGSDYDEKEDANKKFRKMERDFQRWFNGIQARDTNK